MVVPCRGGLSHAQEGFVMQKRAVPCKEVVPCMLKVAFLVLGVNWPLLLWVLGNLPWVFDML